MQKKLSKDELQRQVAHVTLDIQKLQAKIQDLRDVFDDLDQSHVEARGCCFPFDYIMFRDMVQDVSEVADRLQQKWYGATHQPANTRNRPRGTVSRLVENCRAFAATRQAFNQYEAILDGLSKQKKADLERILGEKQTELAQQKVVFNQLQNLLQQLQDLHTQSQQRWFLPRYFMLKGGVRSALEAFKTVAGLSSSTLPSSGNDKGLPVNGRTSKRNGL